MGAGKSAAGTILKDYMPVLDLDAVNREMLHKGNAGYEALIKLDWIRQDANGEIDKAAMAASMFSNPAEKKEAEAILHPLLWEAMEGWAKKCGGKGICAVEVPLLFETNGEDRFDAIWCIAASRQTAIRRLKEGRNIESEDAEKRLNAQMDPEEKAKRSTRVFYNEGSLQDLRAQIEQALKEDGCV